VNVLRLGTIAVSALLIALGLAVVVRSVAAGVGGGLGLLVGLLLAGAGALRLYVAMR
jgi:hypothetical protein